MPKPSQPSHDQPEQQIDNGKQGTQKPWERPGQVSQNLDQPEPKKRERDDEDNKTS